MGHNNTIILHQTRKQLWHYAIKNFQTSSSPFLLLEFWTTMMATIKDNLEELINQKNILLFDGECIMCDGTVKFVIERDPEAKISFAPLQSGFFDIFFYLFTHPSFHLFFLIKRDTHTLAHSHTLWHTHILTRTQQIHFFVVFCFFFSYFSFNRNW